MRASGHLLKPFLTVAILFAAGLPLASAQNCLNLMRANGEAIRPHAEAASLPPDYAALVFNRSPDVTQAVDESAIERLAAGLLDEELHRFALEAITNGFLRRHFQQRLDFHGLSNHDLGDVLAVHLLMIWQMLEPEYWLYEPRKKGLEAVPSRVRETLARSAWPRELGDEEKQVIADTVIIETMVLALRHFDASGRNRSGFGSLWRDLQEVVSGCAWPDRGALYLTKTGFPPHSP